MLSKWKKEIPAECNVCKENENHKHMLYDCVKVKQIWNVLGNCLNVDIRWKHIVIGYFTDLNVTTNNINMLCSQIAYSIFKANNNCKWNQLDYNNVDVKRKVINDLQQFSKMQLYCQETYISQNCISNIVQKLEC